ncbi:CBR-SYN-16 protein, related [Neospora caninum Liverpool]|uniref:CBR-SYN-16 protein, related n=1 Tax=Neospora caninum (strain Liverpool) TaxID=572307 RepID=F0VQI0_NEOCL|nr:CBR-SYN-16 protein, related [Neospora caninum Liverpool]CBZ55977.1 CBR-SYN-16 protein, related [Neospora caninum Liverpool]|eukprot:XP_003886003.1 CBR-SYN-16 protein, related [Neospora caninum Liverpool]
MAATLAARNITSQFLKYRMEYKSKKHRFGKSLLGTTGLSSGNAVVSSPISSRGRQRLLSHQSDEEEGVEMTPTNQHLPPLWADMVEEAHDDVEQIKEKMSQLQKAQQRRLLKVFDDGEGHANPDREIDALTANLTHLFKRCEGRIQQICVTQTPDSDTRSDQLLQRNAQRSIAAQLQALNAAFRSQQKTYLAGERRCRREGVGFADDMLSELALMEQDADLRQGELAKIAQSMADLHQIFKDLSNLVIDQGTILDRIDYNVEQVLQNTTQANVQLRKAEENQRSGRAAKCIVFLVITIFFLLVLLIMKHT